MSTDISSLLPSDFNDSTKLDAISFAINLIDLKEIAAPISQEKPAGENVRYHPIYDFIRIARTDEDDELPKGIWLFDAKRSEWEKVAKYCYLTLVKLSKDLNVAIWLLEALYHTKGVSGIIVGLDILKKMVDVFWDDLYPPIEQDDFEYRVSPFVWLNEKFSEKVMLTPISVSSLKDTSYSYADVVMVQDFETRWKRFGQNKPFPPSQMTFADVQKGMALTSGSFYASLRDALVLALEKLSDLNDLLDQKCANQSPSLANLRKVFSDILQFISKHAVFEDQILPMEQSGEISPSIPMAVTQDQVKNMQVQDDIKKNMEQVQKGYYLNFQNRVQAYEVLNQVADYLLANEPHSPVPYLVKKAVTWSDLSLLDLMTEMGQNEVELNFLKRLLALPIAK